MLTDGNHRPGSVKMGYFALKFLFCHIFHKEWAKEYLPTPKVAKTLPLVFSKEEVEDVLRVFQKQDTVWDEIRQAISAYQKPNCPVCKKGRMQYWTGLFMPRTGLN